LLKKNANMHWIDPDSLPSFSGRVATLIPNPHGDLDGLLLADGTQVHFPPHLSAAVARRIKPGSQVTVRAVRARSLLVWHALALDDAAGRRVEDLGPDRPGKHPAKHAPAKASAKRQAVEVAGTVAHVLGNGKGHAHGMLLEDGTVVRFDPHAADDLREFLQPGVSIGVSGQSLRTRWGTMVEADFVWHDDDAAGTGEASST
jgi:hypothetical protein